MSPHEGQAPMENSPLGPVPHGEWEHGMCLVCMCRAQRPSRAEQLRLWATTYALDTLYAIYFARDYTRNARLLERALEMQGTSVRLSGDGTVSMVNPEFLEGMTNRESR